MKRRLVAFSLCLLFLISIAVAQTSQSSDSKLTNSDVIELVGLGLSEGVIADKIATAPMTSFDTSIQGLKTLKAAHVPEAVLRAMITWKPVEYGNDLPPVAQGASSSALQTAAPEQPNAPTPPVFHSKDGKVRVYVTDNPIFEQIGLIRGSSYSHASADAHGGNMSASAHSSSSEGGVSHTQAGDDPRTVEIQADILKVCPSYVMVSNNPDRADYVLVFRRQGGKRTGFFAMGGLTGLALSSLSKVDGAALFQQNGDMVFATKATTVEKSIKDICLHVPVPTGTAPPTKPAGN